MSAETITTALFLITAVIAAGVLINAVYPVVYNMAGTFSSATHESDVRMRTDFKVIATAGSGSAANIWMKNIGSERIQEAEIQNGDVFFGETGNFDRIEYGDWTYQLSDTNSNNIWDSGETVKITITGVSLSSGHEYYFQFSLPNGVWRSDTFTAS
ncbi:MULTISPECIES: flagellin [unclassified Methanoregula]|uniref:flagellin n=1 Tax=unclassified Methanoregula TaxID=2649730 RepID=UPI0009C7AE9C|nr:MULTISPECIES: flagellin [unclassified Methanoregula]OPX64506.1 MAG: Archaebacterial flagellin [Methanoregula sp. PtaB.Bin085]OPY37307.1 MAG: Archaebacterial flagellin [Methanoregula sp. PtaU1.Bin006]